MELANPLQRIFVASGNLHKAAEFAEMGQKSGLPVKFLGVTAVGGMPAVEENATDYLGNARIKALALAEKVGPEEWILADDSGLEVDALEGRPGIHSARYGGVGTPPAKQIELLLEEVKGAVDRRARFRCVLVMGSLQAGWQSFEGVLEGRLLFRACGEQGFGYDPIFCPVGYSQSLAELGPAVKDRISHRAVAFGRLVNALGGGRA